MSGRSKPRCLLRLYRAGVLATLAALVHSQAAWFAEQEPSPISLRQAGRFFPEARHINTPDPRRGLHVVTDPLDNTLGGLMTTAPWTDHIIGYSGPNNLLIALDPMASFCGWKCSRPATPKNTRTGFETRLNSCRD